MATKMLAITRQANGQRAIGCFFGLWSPVSRYARFAPHAYRGALPRTTQTPNIWYASPKPLWCPWKCEPALVLSGTWLKDPSCAAWEGSLWLVDAKPR